MSWVIYINWIYSFSAIQEFPPIYKNPTFHPQISNFPPHVHVLNKIEDLLFYSFEIYFNIILGPDPFTLHTFDVPNLMSNSQSLHHSKVSVEVCGSVKWLVTQYLLRYWAVSTSPNQQTGGHPYRMFATAYSVYYQTTLHTCWLSPPSQPEIRPHRVDKKVLSIMIVFSSSSIFSSINSVTGLG